MGNHKVLWIDGNLGTMFRLLAYKKDLDIIRCNCYAAGINALSQRVDEFEAVVFDVDCPETKSDANAPSAQAFGNYVNVINGLCSANGRCIPWFVTTTDDNFSAEHIGYMSAMSGRFWDDHLYYNKSKRDSTLFDNIVKAVETTEERRIKSQYKSVFEICPSEKYAELLLEILKRFDKEDSGMEFFDKMQNLLVMMADYLKTRGFEWEKEGAESDTKQNKAKKYLEKVSIVTRRKLVPGFVSDSFSACCEAVSDKTRFTPCSDYVVREFINEGKAPFLASSMVYELLNFLYWAYSLPREPEAIDNIRMCIDMCMENYRNKGK